MKKDNIEAARKTAIHLLRSGYTTRKWRQNAKGQVHGYASGVVDMKPKVGPV
ncbi:MAG: hypothetical protein R3A44_12385 [Caldilineaceae bacterium]